MELLENTIQDLSVVNIVGDLTLDAVLDAKIFVEGIIKKKAFKGLVLNCSNINLMDSNGIGFLVNLYKNLSNLQKPFALSNLSEQNTETLSMLDLDKIFNIFTSEEEAINYCVN